eukprot:gnl/Chilomastix_caulleri/3720.p1 GENE.gnl/Chilomastix_caulleri/3720~~gnl/Chilomastix_caulleri/3720.p1  ORF type:complete len:85 (-),score=14.85 gnl/Chilomastix_caulleri/3720:215-469(-)
MDGTERWGFKDAIEGRRAIELPSQFDSSTTVVNHANNMGIMCPSSTDTIEALRTNFRGHKYADEYCIPDGANILPIFILTEEGS